MSDGFVFIPPLEDRPGNGRKSRYFSSIFLGMSPVRKVGGYRRLFYTTPLGRLEIMSS
jgi:hypothetical protein